MIKSNFARYFSEIYAPNNGQRASSLHNEYLSLRANYFGFPLSSERAFDTELVSKVLLDLKCEHLLRAHPILPVILSKLFQLSLLHKRVPAGFGCSYIVPLPKSSDSISKATSCEDFRGIAICPIISKPVSYTHLTLPTIYSV